MYCVKCNHHISKCSCGDIKERLASLGGSPHLVMTYCSGCGEHHSQCACPDPKPALEQRAQGQIVVVKARRL